MAARQTRAFEYPRRKGYQVRVIAVAPSRRLGAVIFGYNSITGSKNAKDRIRFTCPALGTVSRIHLELACMSRGLRLAPKDFADEHPWLSVRGKAGEAGELTVEECEELLRSVIEQCGVKLSR